MPAPAEVPRVDDGRPVDVDALRDVLADLLRDGDTAALAELARAAVDALGRSGASGTGVRGAGAQPSWSAYQALRVLSPGDAAGADPRPICARTCDEMDGFTDEVLRREIRDRIAAFRRMVTDEVRRRTAEIRGREQVARSAVPVQTEQVEFLSAHAEQLARLRRTVHPLARRLASRLAVRRRHAKRGELDMRRTLRRSMSTGGVPMRPAYRTRRPGRPELVVLCDVSGSVAGFSHFTLLLVQALREQFSKVRVFAFVERADEVTHLFEPGAELSGVMQRVLREADLVAFDGHSDYGGSFGSFAEHWGDAVGPKSSLLVLGDARTNYRDPNLHGAQAAGRAGPARALAQPRAAAAVGQRRLGRPALRRRPPDARVPYRRAARRRGGGPAAGVTDDQHITAVAAALVCFSR